MNAAEKSVRGLIRRVALTLMLALLFPVMAVSQAFDHEHGALTNLLARHVKWNAQGTASSVDYAGFMRDRAALGEVLSRYSDVSPAQYDGFTRDQQLAFLINAYNAFTIELILTKYPDLDSIKDLGGLFSGSPWKKEFFSLLGDKRHLDWVEHGMIRKPGVFDDPRIHFAVNCASIGCPALRPEAFVASRLDAQLQDNTRRFMSDRTRNFYDAGGNELKVSKIFDWYGEDFSKGYKGVKSLKGFLAGYAKEISDDPAVQGRIAAAQVEVDFATYDWKLNKR